MASYQSFYTIFNRMLSNDLTHKNNIFVINDHNFSYILLFYRS